MSTNRLPPFSPPSTTVPTPSSPTSGASTGVGQYFVDLNLGTPPQKLVLIADIGSDLIWVTCSLCRNCSSRPPGSSFCAHHSNTFSLHHCYDTVCRQVPHLVRVPCNHTRLHSPSPEIIC